MMYGQNATGLNATVKMSPDKIPLEKLMAGQKGHPKMQHL